MATTGKGLPRSLGNATIVVPPATTTLVGGVKKSATVAAPAAITAAVAVAAAAAPTQAEFNAFVVEFNKLRTDVTALRTTNANLLTALKASGSVS